MARYKIILTFLFFTTLISCGRNEQVEKTEKETKEIKEIKISKTSNEIKNKTVAEKPEIDSIAKATIATIAISKNQVSPSKAPIKKEKKNDELETEITTKTNSTKSVETIINSPLRNLLNTGQIGKSYTKNELIENYKFPKEAVDLIKQVTFVGKNQLYFKWGSTWLVEKISDAEFENGTMTFVFKENKTYVSGGAIGIKYNKKIYTDLILNKGTAYIPTVKGYHWEIGKK
jgi:hypothetical protein